MVQEQKMLKLKTIINAATILLLLLLPVADAVGAPPPLCLHPAPPLFQSTQVQAPSSMLLNEGAWQAVEMGVGL